VVSVEQSASSAAAPLAVPAISVAVYAFPLR
jgi:hypothetical protein